MPSRRRNSDSENENEKEEVDYVEESGNEADDNSKLSEPLDNISVNADPPATQVNDTFDPVQTL